MATYIIHIILFRCEYATYVYIGDHSAMVKHGLDTSMGSGGAPIFKEHDGKLCLIAMHIGIHVEHESVQYKYGVLISEVLKDIMKKPHSSSKMAFSVK